MRSKESQRQRRLQRSLALAILAVGAGAGMAQTDPYLEAPETGVPRPRLRYIKVDTQFQENSYNNQGASSSSQNQYYVSPGFGISWDYFIYHPDLLTYTMLLEPGYQLTETSGDSGSFQQDIWRVNGHAAASFLRLKPYTTTFTYDRTHEDFQYDIYSSAVVDTETVGALGGYREGPVPFTINVQNQWVDTSGLGYNSSTEQTSLNVGARNQRKRDNFTELNYQAYFYNSSSTSSGQTYDDNSSASYLSLTDQENFERSVLNSSFYYNHAETGDIPADDVNLMLDYTWTHTPNLSSFHDYSFSYFTTDGADSTTHMGRSGLRHQLYESLSTMADVHGINTSSEAPSSQVESTTLGSTLTLGYTKRLAEWAVLSLGNASTYDMTHQDSTGGEQLIFNEPHVVPVGGSFLLNVPNDQSISTITSPAKPPLVESLDYTINTGSNPWQIQILFGGPANLQPGDTVYVTYYAAANPSGNYSTLYNQSNARFSFWNNLAGVYARYGFSQNHADNSGFVLDDYTEFQTGADVNWQRFRLDASFTDRSSSIYNYQSVSLFESYRLLSSQRHTASLNFRQLWNTYPSSGSTNKISDSTFYSYTLSYGWRPTGSLSFNGEAGLQQQRGGLEQDLFVARTYLNWFYARLEFHVGYQYEDQQYNNSGSRTRHIAFIRMRRNF